MAPGYWGPKTANVNWCEQDYVYTPYIAEFFNALSSFSVFACGLYGIVSHVGAVETRFMMSFGAFLVVGVGSFLFHATLRRDMQLLDELPMCWGNSVFHFVLVAMRDEPTGAVRKRYREVTAIALFTIVGTVLVLLFDTETQDMFLLFYGGGTSFVVYRTWALTKEILWANASDADKEFARRDACDPRGHHLVLPATAVLLYGCGLIVWLIDRNFCPAVRQLQLHALWHVCAGLGTLTATLNWIYLRQLVLKKKPRMRGASPLTRWVEVGGVKVV